MKALFALLLAASSVTADPIDPRLRDITFNPQAVVTVPVKRGVVTLIALDGDEAITEVAAGLGGDCSKPEQAWCIAAQPGGHHIFVKPKSTADAANTLAVITDKRSHSFRLIVLADNDSKQPVYRLTVKAPIARPARPLSSVQLAAPPQLTLPSLPLPQSPRDLIAERLQTAPPVQNSAYSLAEGPSSQDIVPTLVFDDGRFTYLRFPGNREVPAVFHVLGDGSETMVNARMEGDLLVVDRVSRHLMLRAGSAVVGVWNDAFDLDGLPPKDGTTIAGVQRVLSSAAQPTRQAKTSGKASEQDHE